MIRVRVLLTLILVVFMLSSVTSVAHAWKRGEQPPAVEFDAPLIPWLRQNPKYDKEKTQWFFDRQTLEWFAILLKTGVSYFVVW